MRLANTIIDGVTDAPAAVAADVAKYFAYDLVCHRADGPDRLVARQAAAWDPVLGWARETLGAHILMAARGYLTWMGECAARPVTDIDLTKDVHAIYARAPQFAEEVLAAWRIVENVLRVWSKSDQGLITYPQGSETVARQAPAG